MRIECEKAVALVIDYQEKLIPVMEEKQKLIENSSILVAGLKTLEIPICITQQYTKGLGMTIEEITQAAGKKEYIDKIMFSAYEAVKDVVAGRQFVIICGIEAHICVLQTIVDLKSNGYTPVLVSDCISSRKSNDRKVAIKRAREEGAIITTYESLLFELLKKAGTDTSKKIQRLIK
ncbi:isochorismatase family protein [Lachnospiraceae bacterium LCP25S3_G4]